MIKTELSKSDGRGRFFRYAPLVLWTLVIFYLSTGQASMSETSRFIRPLLNFLFPGAAEETLIAYHGYIRKLAHFGVYFVLAFFAARAFAHSSAAILRKCWFLFSLILVILVAALDETNQSFNNARTGSIYDVMLDAAGGAAALTLFYVFKRKYRSSPVA